MKKLLFALLLCSPFAVKSQSLYFPPLGGTTWDTISPASLGWCQPPIDSLLDYLGTKNTKAFIVLKGGKIVIEKYYGTFTADSLWYWASAGKTLTAFTTGIAQQQGFLSISDTSSQYLGTGWTSCTAAQEEKITVRHQLTMTSGLDDDVPDHYCTTPACLVYKADAGTRWAYHNGPYTLLDEVIHNATGQTLNAYFNTNVRSQIGMNGLFVPSGYNNVYFSNARSMARFGLLMLNKGNWNGNQLMTDTTYFNAMVNTSQALNPSYGYLWWLNGKSGYMVPGLQFVFPGFLSPHAPADMIAALGKNGQFINVVPSQELVFIRMGNAPGVGEVPALFNDSIWMRLNEVMCVNGLNEQNNTLTGITVYPNPAQTHITVNGLTQTGDMEMHIYDAAGALHLQAAGKKDMDIRALPAGLYLVQVRQGGKIYTQKLVKQ